MAGEQGDAPKEWSAALSGLGASSLRGREIRLLKLLPGDSGSQIRCEVIVVALDRAVYTALSYAWGNPPAECAISLNGQVVKVRKNLWRFLQQARSFSEPLFEHIWIDALCVDQMNDRERTHQVALMGDIYASAERVIAWLGPAHDSSDQAVESISIASPLWTTRKMFAKKWKSPEASAIRSLCVRRYWKRLWIFQELLLARQAALLCGSRRISMQEFRDFNLKISSCTVSDHATELFEFQCVRDSPAVKIMQYIAQRRAESSILHLMRVTRDLHCSDIRDRVFAVLSVDTGPTRNVSADYQKSIPDLANSVLRDYHAFQAPTSLDEIIERCRELSKIMKIDMQDIFCTTKDGLKWNESISLPKALLPYSSGIVQRTHHAASTDDDKPVVKSFAKQMGYDQEYRHVRAALYGGKLQGVPFTFAWAAQWQHTEVVNFLLREGIVKAHKCLADAIVADHYAVVAILLQSSVFRARYHIDWPIANSANALQIAVVCGRVKMVDLLVQAGANVNTRGVDFPHTNTAKTPFAANFVLKIATIRQSPELVANLLAKGAWVDAACAPYTIPGGRTALGAALLTRRLDIIALLRDAGADIQYESTGAADSQLELYELLRSAVKAGSEDLAQVLLDLGAYSHRPRTPEHFAREAKLPLLELAVRSRCTEIVRILLKHGINANYADGVVCTALVVAVRLGEYDMVVALLEHGAEVNSSAEWGSPLSAAIASGSVEMTRLLLKHGAQFKRRPPGVPPRTPLLNGDLPWHLDLMNGDHCFPLP